MTNNDSISQHKAIQLSNLKQFNCSIEKKNIIHGKGTKHDITKSCIYINLIAFDIAKMASTCIQS